MKRGWCYLQRNKWSWKASLVFCASAFQTASDGKRRVTNPLCQLCPWCTGNLQEDLVYALCFPIAKKGNWYRAICKVLWGMWMKVLIIISASTLQDVPQSLWMSKKYLDETSEIILLFEHTISSFNIFIWKVFYISDAVSWVVKKYFQECKAIILKLLCLSRKYS